MKSIQFSKVKQIFYAFGINIQLKYDTILKRPQTLVNNDSSQVLN